MMAPAATFRFSLAPAHWMIDRVHDHSADVRPAAAPACSSGLAAGNVHVINISHLSHRGVTTLVDASNLTRGHFDQAIAAFAVIKSGLLTGATGDLTSAARRQFDVVNARAKRDCSQGQSIAKIGCYFITSRHPCSDGKSIGRENIIELPIHILDQSNPCRAIRVIFDPDDLGLDAALSSFEIYFAVMLFVAAADVTRSQPAKMIPAATFLFRLQKALGRSRLCNLLKGRERLETGSR